MPVSGYREGAESPVGRGRRWLWRLAALAVFALSVLAGLWVSQQAAPERLRREIEGRLTRVTGAPCVLPDLEVRLGLPIEFVGRGLALWEGALEVRELTARVSVSSALMGELRITRLEADGLRLSLRGGEGVEPVPPWLAPRDPETREPAEGSALERGAGLAVGALHGILERVWLANRVEVRDGRLELAWASEAGPLDLALSGLEGEVFHSELLGTSELWLRTGLEREGAAAGLLELEARQEPGGELRADLSATDVDLALLESWIPPGRGRVAGALSGAVGVDLPAPDPAAGSGTTELEFELSARDLQLASQRPLWTAARASAVGRVQIEPARVRLVSGRITGAPLDANLQATLTRPLGDAAVLDLLARVSDLDRAELPKLLETLPLLDLGSARAALESVDRGRLRRVSFQGKGRLADWRDRLAGEPVRLDEPLTARAHFQGLRIRLGGDTWIDQADFQLELSGDDLSVSKATGLREGELLPLLDLELRGLSHLRRANLADRVPETPGGALSGLPLLLRLFQPHRDDRADRFVGPHVEVELARLDHPTLLWPLRDVSLSIDGQRGGLRAEILRADWAGVPLRGQLDWNADPRHLTARLELSAAREAAETTPQASPAADAVAGAAAVARPGAAWSRGSFRIGRLHSRIWSHEELRGEFRAQGTTLRFAGLEAQLLPSGTARGRGHIELGEASNLGYGFEVDGRDLDADALLTQAGLGAGFVTGLLHLRGDIRNRYEPGVHPLAHLSGQLDVKARDGEVRQELPAVLALTLASDIFRLNPAGDTVRYDTCRAVLEAEEGIVRTSALELDGPDVRLFGSGSLDLGHPPHKLDAEVAVFLFRPVDQALGRIPVVGQLILGGSENLLAAYFQVRGPWDEPKATAQPLRSFFAGPLRLVEQVPGVVRRGVDALGGAVGTRRDGRPPRDAP